MHFSGRITNVQAISSRFLPSEVRTYKWGYSTLDSTSIAIGEMI